MEWRIARVLILGGGSLLILTILWEDHPQPTPIWMWIATAILGAFWGIGMATILSTEKRRKQ